MKINNNKTGIKIALLPLLFVIVLISGCSFAPHQDIIIPKNTELIGVYAYLNETTNTDCTIAGEWYNVEGVFVNNPVEGFYYDATLNAIVYNSTKPRWIIVDTASAVAADKNGVTISGRIFRNNESVISQSPSRYIKYAGEYYSLSGDEVLYMKQGDYLNIKIMVDIPAIVTFDYITTDAIPFFN